MNAQAIENYLTGIPTFAGLDAEAVRTLARTATVRDVLPDETLFRQGEPAKTFYLVRSGNVSVEIPALYGPRLEIQSLGEDEILGWSWLMPPYRWSFQAKANAPSQVLEFDGEALLERCEADPKFGYELMKRFALLMSERLEAARRRMMDQWNPSGFA